MTRPDAAGTPAASSAPAVATSPESAANAPEPAAIAPESAASFTRYKVMAYITGVFLLLLCAEMLMKYVFHLNGVDENGDARDVLGVWIAIVHGWIYVVYAVTCLQLWSKARWGFGRLAVMILGGIVPVLSFVVEARAARWPIVRRRSRPAA